MFQVLGFSNYYLLSPVYIHTTVGFELHGCQSACMGNMWNLCFIWGKDHVKSVHSLK